MRIVALMMQKNEVDLLEPWVNFHGSLFGYENLHVFDNGSDQDMTKQFETVTELGVNLDKSKTSYEDFQSKGTVLATKIRNLDASDPADFYMPLDCDEFVGVQRSDGTISFDINDIYSELEKYRDSPEVLMIAAGYDNHPTRLDYFVPKPSRRKCFFAQNSCFKLDLGFHRAATKKGKEPIKTNIVHVHLHFKPLELLKFSSRQKLSGRVKDFEIDTLKQYKENRGAGFHLVDHLLLEDEAQYISDFETRYRPEKYAFIPAFSEKFRQIGVERPF